MRILAEMLKHCSLEKLSFEVLAENFLVLLVSSIFTQYLQGAHVQDAGGAEFFNSLKNNSTIQALQVPFNRLASSSAVEIRQCLELNSTLQELDISVKPFFLAPNQPFSYVHLQDEYVFRRRPLRNYFWAFKQ